MDLTERHDLRTGTAPREDGQRAAGHERLWPRQRLWRQRHYFRRAGGELLTAELTGQPDPEIECFDPYRFNDTQS
jgi:hypothetical protein